MISEQNSTQHNPALDWALLSVRLIVGVIFMAHGAQKLFGAFGGPGLEAVLGPQGPGGGGATGLLVAVGEFFGGLGILAGFLARFSSAANILTMLGAIYLVHGKNGLFAAAGGFEYNLALIGLLIPVLILGPGRLSLAQVLPLKRSAHPGRAIPVLE